MIHQATIEAQALPAERIARALDEALDPAPVAVGLFDRGEGRNAEENEAVMEDLRPDEVPAGREAMPPKGSSEEEHGNHEKAEDLETEEIQKDMAPDTVPSGE